MSKPMGYYHKHRSTNFNKPGWYCEACGAANGYQNWYCPHCWTDSVTYNAQDKEKEKLRKELKEARSQLAEVQQDTSLEKTPAQLEAIDDIRLYTSLLKSIKDDTSKKAQALKIEYRQKLVQAKALHTDLMPEPSERIGILESLIERLKKRERKTKDIEELALKEYTNAKTKHQECARELKEAKERLIQAKREACNEAATVDPQGGGPGLFCQSGRLREIMDSPGDENERLAFLLQKTSELNHCVMHIISEYPTLRTSCDAAGLSRLQPDALGIQLHKLKFRKSLALYPLGQTIPISDVMQHDVFGTLVSFVGDKLGQASKAFHAARESFRYGERPAQGMIFVLGGGDPNGLGYTNAVDRYDTLAGEWQSMAPMALHRTRLAAAALNGKIYALGGENEWTTFAKVERYDPVPNCWEFVAPMNVARSGLGAVTLRKSVYAIGGWGYSYEPLFSVEQYNAVSDTWEQMVAMRIARREMSAVALDGSIYVLGGSSFAAYSMERYRVDLGEWQDCAQLPSERQSIALVSSKGKIFAIGGYGERDLALVESYDPINNRWEEFVSLQEPRQLPAAIAVGDSMYVMGGASNWSRGSSDNGCEARPFVSTVERYSHSKGSWEDIEQMPNEHWASATTVLFKAA